MKFIKRIWRTIGPGVVTGAADDDPSGIATYSQAGAQFGYGQLWMAIFMLPLQAAIQEACARIGAVTGMGIAAVIKQHFNKKVLTTVSVLVLVANIINIGADISVMAEAAQLIVPANLSLLMLMFTLVTLLLEIFVDYKKYARVLLFLSLFLMAYLITIFIVDAPWLVLLKSTFVPHVQFSFEFLFIATGVLGTTISPYLFFWQASQEVEEERIKGMIKADGTPRLNRRFMHFIRFLRWDNFIGMFFSEVTAWSIIAVAATVFHANGITDIKTAADAAKALQPLVNTFPHSGYLATLIFSIGIIGLGLLSIPVLAASSAYAVSEALGWKEGLNSKFNAAPGFYGVIILATLIGLCLNVLGVSPFKALIYAAVINGVVAPFLIFIVAIIARSRKIMGIYRSGWLSTSLVWLTFAVMSMATAAMCYAFICEKY